MEIEGVHILSYAAICPHWANRQLVDSETIKTMKYPMRSEFNPISSVAVDNLIEWKMLLNIYKTTGCKFLNNPAITMWQMHKKAIQTDKKSVQDIVGRIKKFNYPVNEHPESNDDNYVTSLANGYKFQKGNNYYLIYNNELMTFDSIEKRESFIKLIKV